MNRGDNMEDYPAGLFIRDYLLKHGEGRPYDMWKEYTKLVKKDVKLKTFYTYISILSKLGLVEISRIMKKRRGRTYYYRLTERGKSKEAEDVFARPMYYVRLMSEVKQE